MGIPDLSNLLYVARLRYIQTIHESPQRANPDTLVRNLVPWLTKVKARMLSQSDVRALRKDPFYDYLIARTKYYDSVFADAIRSGVRLIVSVGCGTDTRPYRFEQDLRRGHVRVLECDQMESIDAKRRAVAGWKGADLVTHLAVDLNNDWGALEAQLVDLKAKVLVMMEGVTPYLQEDRFADFLSRTGKLLPAGSLLAYDFKIKGVDDNFGIGGQTTRPFRLSIDAKELEQFHAPLGYRVEHFESAVSLSARLVPRAPESADPSSNQDALIRLQVVGAN